MDSNYKANEIEELLLSTIYIPQKMLFEITGPLPCKSGLAVGKPVTEPGLQTALEMLSGRCNYNNTQQGQRDSQEDLTHREQ